MKFKLQIVAQLPLYVWCFFLALMFCFYFYSIFQLFSEQNEQFLQVISLAIQTSLHVQMANAFLEHGAVIMKMIVVIDQMKGIVVSLLA